MKKILIMSALVAMISGSVFADGVTYEEHSGSLNTNANNSAPVTTHTNSGNSTTNTNSNNTDANQIIGSAGNVNNVSTSEKTETTILTTPSIGAPGLTTGGVDTCLGSASGGLSIVGLGISGGKTHEDANCKLLKQVKLLVSLGLKDAAVALLIQSDPAIKEALLIAYPELVEKLDPELKANNERKAKLQAYIDAGLEPPAHLLNNSVTPVADGTVVGNVTVRIINGEKVFTYPKSNKVYWYENKGGVDHRCSEGFLGLTTCSAHNYNSQLKALLTQ